MSSFKNKKHTIYIKYQHATHILSLNVQCVDQKPLHTSHRCEQIIVSSACGYLFPIFCLCALQDKWLLHSVLMLVQSWIKPLVYLQTTMLHYDYAPDLLLNKTKWVSEKLISLEQGVVALIKKVGKDITGLLLNKEYLFITNFINYMISIINYKNDLYYCMCTVYFYSL